MIRIVHAVSSLSQGSGVMSFIMNYYKKINRDEIQFDFVYFSEKDTSYKNEILAMGGRIYFLGKPSLNRKYLDRAETVFRDIGPGTTAIHCHPIFSSVILSKLAKRHHIKNVIQHSHSPKYSNKILSSIRNRLLSYCFRWTTDYYVACTAVAGKLLRTKGPILIVNNAIDPDVFAYSNEARKNIRSTFNIDELSFVIGNIGRMDVEKNHSFLIEIFSEIVTIQANSHLILVGEGPLRAVIEKQILALGLQDKVIFTGIRSDANEILSAMDAFVLPSHFEGLGIVALEAQANGMKTFCSDGVPEDVYVSPLAEKFHLADTPKSIALRIVEQKRFARKPIETQLKEAGYDINDQAIMLQDFYKSM